MATKVRIKRSTTAAPSTLDGGELAYTSLNDVLYIGSPATGNAVTAIGGKRFPGTLTANQALVANSTSGIDKVIVANLVPTAITANSSQGTAGDVLFSNGTGVYWKAPSAGVSGSDTQVQFNDGGTLAGDAGLTYNKTTDSLSSNNFYATSVVNAASHTVGTSLVANSLGVYHTGVVNAATLSVGSSVVANASRLAIATSVGLQANGGIGTDGQILYSNGSTAYWANPPVGDITGVTAGSGLTGGGASGDVTLNVGAGNGIAVDADSIRVQQANGIAVTSGGVYVDANATGGLIANATGLHVLAGSGLLSNSTGLHVGTGNGIAVDADSLRVVAGNTQLVSNSTGVWITQTNIDHNSLSNYDANRHIDHTAVSITAGNGLTGGGTIAATRTIDVGAGNGIAVAADSVAVLANSGIVSNSTGVFVDANTTGGLVANATGLHVGAGSGLVTNSTGLHVGTGNGIAVDADSLRVVAGNTQVVSNSSGVWVVQSNIDHNSLSNYDANRHVDHTAVSITAGNGLSGGGTIAASRTLNVLANSGIVSNSTGVFVLANNGLVSNSTGVFALANNGIVSNSSGIFALANTSSGLIANATGIHAKVSPTVILDGTGNLAVNSAALSFTDLTVSGNLVVLGDLVSLNVSTLAIEDPLFVLAKDQSNTTTYTDAVDIGFFGTYGNTQVGNNKFTGLFRDQSDSGIYKLFDGAIPAPTTTVDTGNVNFAFATLQSFLKSSALTTNATHVAITANSTVNVTITANSLTLATALAATSGGTGQSTYAVGDLLVGGATNTLTKLTLGADGKVLQSSGTTIIYDDIDGGTFS